MKMTKTRHDGRPGNCHVINYDAAIILRFLPAAAGEDFGVVWDGLSGEEWSLKMAEFECNLLLAFGLGACEWPLTFLYALLGKSPFESLAWGIGDGADGLVKHVLSFTIRFGVAYLLHHGAGIAGLRLLLREHRPCAPLVHC